MIIYAMLVFIVNTLKTRVTLYRGDLPYFVIDVSCLYQNKQRKSINSDVLLRSSEAD
jgi:hypothetical protein